MKTFSVGEEYNGSRADKFLHSEYPAFTRSAVAKLIDAGLVRRSGSLIKTGDKLKTGDEISVEDDLLVGEPPVIDLPVIYEDDDCVVINKPVGILSHSKGAFNPEMTVADWLKRHARLKDAGNRAGIVHRLDRTTSGVMLTAKNDDARRFFQKQFSNRNVKKTYIAIVKGHFAEKEAVIDMPIERNPANPKTFRVSTTGRSAATKYQVLTETAGHSVVSLMPQTGRTHQLRVHMKAVGHPILGDTLYGGEQAIRVYLHALELEITMPDSSRQVFTAPLPAEFTEGIS